MTGENPTKRQIYKDVKPISMSVMARRFQFAGHCLRANHEIISSLILWKPIPIGTRSKKLTFTDVISRDTGINKLDLKMSMRDTEHCRNVVKSIVSTAVEE